MGAGKGHQHREHQAFLCGLSGATLHLSTLKPTRAGWGRATCAKLWARRAEVPAGRGGGAGAGMEGNGRWKFESGFVLEKE